MRFKILPLQVLHWSHYSFIPHSVIVNYICRHSYPEDRLTEAIDPSDHTHTSFIQAVGEVSYPTTQRQSAHVVAGIRTIGHGTARSTNCTTVAPQRVHEQHIADVTLVGCVARLCLLPQWSVDLGCRVFHTLSFWQEAEEFAPSWRSCVTFVAATMLRRVVQNSWIIDCVTWIKSLWSAIWNSSKTYSI